MGLLQSDRLLFRAEHDDLMETGPVIATCPADQMPSVAFHLRMETDKGFRNDDVRRASCNVLLQKPLELTSACAVPLPMVSSLIRCGNIRFHRRVEGTCPHFPKVTQLDSIAIRFFVRVWEVLDQDMGYPDRFVQDFFSPSPRKCQVSTSVKPRPLPSKPSVFTFQLSSRSPA
jgi:hypothetical protein